MKELDSYKLLSFHINFWSLRHGSRQSSMCFGFFCKCLLVGMTHFAPFWGVSNSFTIISVLIRKSFCWLGLKK